MRSCPNIQINSKNYQTIDLIWNSKIDLVMRNFFFIRSNPKGIQVRFVPRSVLLAYCKGRLYWDSFPLRPREDPSLFKAVGAEHQLLQHFTGKLGWYIHVSGKYSWAGNKQKDMIDINACWFSPISHVLFFLCTSRSVVITYCIVCHGCWNTHFFETNEANI